MISKERLEELIEQGATIYVRDIYNVVGSIDFCEYEGRIFKNCFQFRVKIKPNLSNYYGCEPNWSDDILLENIFETKEDAKWYKEFGCIERTERLELPTWEEFYNGEFCHFISKECKYSLSPDLIHNTIFLYECVWGGGFYIHSRWELTKENYTLACRKCKELFLGEKK